MGVTKWFGSLRRKLLERPGETVDLEPLRALLPPVLAREKGLKALGDGELSATATELRESASIQFTLDDEDTLVTTLALAREAARRGIEERPFDVQLLGAQVLIAGHVAQMATGEGKTLTAAVAATGLAASGPVHILTVNDYLARRDAEWMGPIFRLLGLTVGWVNESSTRDERRAAYECDVTYVSANEAGFDFLRDSIVTDIADRVQPELTNVIIDEADSILIDEARVPLVLAGSTSESEDLPQHIAEVMRTLRKDEHYELVDEGRAVHLTPEGLTEVEKQLEIEDLYHDDHNDTLSSVNVALHAETLVRRDVDYIVRDGRVELIDEFRGRVARRRRWPDGLHAAVEAKEKLNSTGAGKVLATITMQAFVGRYKKIAGMTGTALPVGEQLREFYRLEVAVIPPNEPNIREDHPDRVYATRDEKDDALVDEITNAHERGRPVLIGTPSVAESERLGAILSEAGVDCVVLNAKNDEREASIIAEAGAYGAVTVSTQMTGRGVDIRLGGSDESDRDRVVALGGLYAIGTARHTSRRVDDQLRGRAGRQGDPGESLFIVSLEDDLMKRYPPARVPDVRKGSGLLEHPGVLQAVLDAQRIAEQVDLEIHRTTWRYHYVLEQQRQLMADKREELLTTDLATEMFVAQLPDEYDTLVETHGEAAVGRVFREIALFHFDMSWATHLSAMTDLREGIHLRVLGRQDPLDEFHREAIPAFHQEMAEFEALTRKDFEALDWEEGEWSAEQAGLIRPSATWTYLVSDDPFGSETERAIAGLVKLLGGRSR